MKRLTLVEPDMVSRPDPAILDAIDAMAASAKAAVPVSAMVLWESQEGEIMMRSYPDSPALRRGLIDWMHGSIHVGEDE